MPGNHYAAEALTEAELPWVHSALRGSPDVWYGYGSGAQGRVNSLNTKSFF